MTLPRSKPALKSRHRRRRTALGASLLAALSGVFGLAHADAVRYQIDPGHTYPTFAISHLGLSQLRGRFNKTEGWIELDQAQQSGRAEITVAIASLDSGHAARDYNLLNGVMGVGFFQVERFSTMSYRAEHIRFDNGQPRVVDGELTLLGVTRPLPLTISRFHCAFNPLRLSRGCGATASGRLQRSEFGMEGLTSLIGDEVELSIDVEAYPVVSANQERRDK